MPKCSFCGQNIFKGTGTMFAKKDGNIYFFCSSKCEKNLLKLKRAPQTKKWTIIRQQKKKAKQAQRRKEK